MRYEITLHSEKFLRDDFGGLVFFIIDIVRWLHKVK